MSVNSQTTLTPLNTEFPPQPPKAYPVMEDHVVLFSNNMKLGNKYTCTYRK